MGSGVLTLRELIVEQGQTAAADALGFSAAYVSQLMTGARPVTAAVLRAALDVYGNRLDVVGTLREMRAQRRIFDA